jgi:hypothetical protein
MRIRPLTLAAVGVTMVALDMRVVAVDLLPDVVGWLLVAFAAWRLSMHWPARLATLAALASTAELQLPYRYDKLDPLTWEVVSPDRPGDFPERLAFDAITGTRLVLLVVAGACGAAALVLLLRELAARAGRTGAKEEADRLRQLLWAVAGVWAVPYLGLAVGQGLLDEDGFDPVWNMGGELLALAGLAAMGAVALTFVLRSNRQWSARTADASGSPWAEMMVRNRAG